MAILPKGASDKADLARTIARDQKRVLAASSYWTKRFAEAGETVFDTGKFSSPGLRFAAALPDQRFVSLLPDTDKLVAASEDDQMAKRSGCLMSLVEITRHLDGKADPTKTADALNALPAATVPIEDPGMPSVVTADQVAFAIRVARELYDVIRRFAYCETHAADLSVPVDELLAIFRREGAFVVAPPVSSYRLAPVVDTEDAACRTHSVPLDWDHSATRGGFVMSHLQANIPVSTKADESRSFGLLMRNMLCVAGVDTILLSRLPKDDELLFLLDRAIEAKPQPAQIEGLHKDLRANLAKTPAVGATLFRRQSNHQSQVDVFDAMSLGLMMLRLEEGAPASPAPEADALLTGLETDMRELFECHAASAPEAGRIFIESDDEGTDTKRLVRIQASWYASRKRVDTLLARRDRAVAAGADPFSPFLAYLRYNVGDAAFMGALIRFLAMFDAIRKAARGKNAWPNAALFRAEADKLVWAKADQREAEKWLKDWRAVGGESAWRHMGLIDQVVAAGLRPVWLPNPPAPSKQLATTAAVAKATIEKLLAGKFMPAVDVLFRTARVKDVAETFALIGFRDPEPRRIAMAKAHNFDQMRRVNAKTLGDAGLAAP
jgi:transcriptional regulator with XRE-family HTH domain